MARTVKADLPQVSLPIGNGSSILTPTFPLLDLGKYTRTSDFSINAPNVKIDADIRKMVEKLSERLRVKALNYEGEEPEWQLEAILERPDGVKDNAKSKLVRDGRSAVVSDVSKSISASNIDHSSKYLLSNEALYVYALSYAVYKEGVEDAEGVNDRILAVTQNKIKAFLNKKITEKIIQDRHLNVTPDQRSKILAAASLTNMSYLNGEPVKAINKIISKYIDYGQLNILVDKFFESGIIDAEKGTPQVRQHMVRYLIEIGLTVAPEDIDGAPAEGEGKGEKAVPPVSGSQGSKSNTEKSGGK